jgi:riboflavin kinase
MKGAVRATDLLLLRALASRGSMQRRVKVTTSSLAAELGVSQQAVSAALIRLQERGLVERSLAARGQLVKLAKSGTAILRADYAAYKRLFE